MHENYTSKSVLDSLKKIDDRVKFNTYDEIQIRKQKKFETEMNNALEFIKEDRFGIEIDLDAIPNIASSAMTLSGFSIEKLRQFIYYFGNNQNAAYLHICEGAPDLGEEKNNHVVSYKDEDNKNMNINNLYIRSRAELVYQNIKRRNIE